MTYNVTLEATEGAPGTDVEFYVPTMVTTLEQGDVLAFRVAHHY